MSYGASTTGAGEMFSFVFCRRFGNNNLRTVWRIAIDDQLLRQIQNLKTNIFGKHAVNAKGGTKGMGVGGVSPLGPDRKQM